MGKIKNSWFSLFKGYNADEKLISVFWQKISAAYSEKGRFYHTLAHISQMLDLSKNYSDRLLDISNIMLSIFYHDIVYSATKNNNEEKSADLATEHLGKLKFPTEKVEKCRKYILATKNHSNPTQDSDLDFFLDFDLEKLGAHWPEYEEYTKQIRQEYKIYPKPLYNKGRKKVLEHFLAMDRIYKTDIFIEQYENQARENLKKELSMLQ